MSFFETANADIATANINASVSNGRKVGRYIAAGPGSEKCIIENCRASGEAASSDRGVQRDEWLGISMT